MNELQVLNNVTRQLAAITSIPEAKDLRDKAEALRQYFKASRQGLKAQNQAAYVKILCERKAGELLSAVPRVQGDRNGKKGLRAMLAQSRIPEQTARRWQYLAKYPEADLLRLVAICNEDEDELTSVFVVEAARAYLNRTARHADTEEEREEPEDEKKNSETKNSETKKDRVPADEVVGHASLALAEEYDRAARLALRDVQAILPNKLSDEHLSIFIGVLRLELQRFQSEQKRRGRS